MGAALVFLPGRSEEAAVGCEVEGMGGPKTGPERIVHKASPAIQRNGMASPFPSSNSAEKAKPMPPKCPAEESS